MNAKNDSARKKVFPFSFSEANLGSESGEYYDREREIWINRPGTIATTATPGGSPGTPTPGVTTYDNSGNPVDHTNPSVSPPDTDYC